MKGSKLAVFLSIMGALALIVAACAPAATPTPTTTPTPPPAVATPTPGAATPTPAPGVATPTLAPVAATPTPVAGMPVGYGYSPFGEWGMPLNMPPPQYGGVFREATTQPPAHWDSHRDYVSTGVRVSSPVWSNLLRFSPYMDFRIIPGTYEVDYLTNDLAEKYEISQDQLVFTFYLKKGVKWSDGKPFTSKDVKYTFDKLLDPIRSVWIANLAMLERTEVVDDYTVKFYLKFPATRHFLLSVGMAHFTIQPEHRKDVSYRIPDFIAVGTGPFIYKSYTAGIELVYGKNPDYYFKGRPYYDALRYPFFPDSAKSAEALAVGQVDFAEYWKIPESPIELIKRVAPDVKMTFSPKLYTNSNFSFSFVKEGPWQDVRVRQALNMVVDRQALCLADYGALTLTEKACFTNSGYLMSPPIGPGLPWSEYEKAWKLGLPLDERIKEAKKLLAQAGYPDGFKAMLLSSGAPAGSLLVIMDHWKRVLNIDIGLRIVPGAQVTELRNRGEFDFISSPTLPTIGSMEQLVNNFAVTGGQMNWARYSHPLVEELYIKLLKEQDRDAAQKIYRQIDRILIDDIPQIYGFGTTWVTAEWPYIKPQMFHHPLYHSSFNSRHSVTWLDKNDPTYAKRAK